MIVADNEAAVDLLYYEAIAKTVVRLVNEKSSEPLSVGVHGDRGAGKSSVLMMIEEAFSDDNRVLCVRFCHQIERASSFIGSLAARPMCVGPLIAAAISP